MLIAGRNYRCVFERIGRNHDVMPLVVEAPEDADDLAREVFDYARKFLMSQDVDVTTDLEAMTGRIFAGMHTAGSFTIARVT